MGAHLRPGQRARGSEELPSESLIEVVFRNGFRLGGIELGRLVEVVGESGAGLCGHRRPVASRGAAGLVLMSGTANGWARRMGGRVDALVWYTRWSVTEEAIVNAMVAAETMEGITGIRAHASPHTG